MTDENGAVASKKKPELRLPSQVDSGIAERLVAQARAEGVDLVGPGGLLSELTKQILEAVSRSRWKNISAMRNTLRRAAMVATPATGPAMAATPATGPARRRC